MELNGMPSAKLLSAFLSPALAGKARSSPATGATLPTQLLAFAQLLLTAPPSQTRVAGASRSSRTSSRVRRDDAGRRLPPERNHLRNMTNLLEGMLAGFRKA